MDQTDPSLAVDRLYADVVANFVAMAVGKPPMWLVYAPLLPLFLLMFSGLYMFVLPYAVKWREGRQTGA